MLSCGYQADPSRDFAKVLRGRNEVDSAWVSFGFKCETFQLSCSLQFNGVEQVVNKRIVSCIYSIYFNINYSTDRFFQC